MGNLAKRFIDNFINTEQVHEVDEFITAWNEAANEPSPSDYEIEEVNKFEIADVVNSFFTTPEWHHLGLEGNGPQE